MSHRTGGDAEPIALRKMHEIYGVDADNVCGMCRFREHFSGVIYTCRNYRGPLNVFLAEGMACGLYEPKS